MTANPSPDRSVTPLLPATTADERWPRDLGAEIARTLHDGVAQDLFVARMSLASLACRLAPGSPERRQAESALEGITAALHRTSRLVDDLRPAGDPADCDLAPALRRELVDFSARTGIAVAFTESGPPSTLPADAVGEVLAIVREALANVHKHAGASHVRLRARHRAGWTRLTIADDGCGFQGIPVGAVEVGLGLGMGAMHQRARAVGGRIALRSAAGAGTTVTIDIPPQGASPDVD